MDAALQLSANGTGTRTRIGGLSLGGEAHCGGLSVASRGSHWASRSRLGKSRRNNEKNQNWNRFYWPGGGTYWEPEPRFTVDPGYVRTLAQMGATPAVYGYANNNPIGVTDEDGDATFHACVVSDVGIDPTMARRGVTGTGLLQGEGATFKCVGENQSNLSIDITNTCKVTLQGLPNSPLYRQSWDGTAPTSYWGVYMHELGHVKDDDQCAQDWITKHEPDEHDYCSREDCRNKANQLMADFISSYTQCVKAASCKRHGWSCQ
jgi:hypothetical protein